MSSAAGSWFQRILVRIPGLYRKQPCGNFHPFWHRLCFCREYEYCGDWRGGILDLKTGAVYVRQEVRQDASGQDVLGKCPDCLVRDTDCCVICCAAIFYKEFTRYNEKLWREHDQFKMESK